MALIEIQTDKVDDLLRSLDGKFFTVTFTKRTTGEERTITATKNYESKLKGGELGYDPKAKALLIVWDIKAMAFKSIPTNAVSTIKALGNIYEVKAGN